VRRGWAESEAFLLVERKGVDGRVKPDHDEGDGRVERDHDEKMVGSSPTMTEGGGVL
jgi:hypothetical protein